MNKKEADWLVELVVIDTIVVETAHNWFDLTSGYINIGVFIETRLREYLLIKFFSFKIQVWWFFQESTIFANRVRKSQRTLSVNWNCIR